MNISLDIHGHLGLTICKIICESLDPPGQNYGLKQLCEIKILNKTMYAYVYTCKYS